MRNKRGLFVGAGAVGLLVAAIGVAHMPFARSLLMTMGGCPMAGSRMTAIEAENARHMALASNPGHEAAPARPALGFALDSTSVANVRDWARREHVDCDDARPGLLKCSEVSPVALGLPAENGSIDELELEFSDQGRLVNMTTFRSHLNPAQAATEAHSIVSSLIEKLGPAGRKAGAFDPAHLSVSGAESISAVTYRYNDYVADVTAMNTPSGGPSIREHYMSAKD